MRTIAGPGTRSGGRTRTRVCFRIWSGEGDHPLVASRLASSPLASPCLLACLLACPLACPLASLPASLPPSAFPLSTRDSSQIRRIIPSLSLPTRTDALCALTAWVGLIIVSEYCFA